MAGIQPTGEQISQVCAITEVDEASARILLKVRADKFKSTMDTVLRPEKQKSNNDVNNAINTFFEDPMGSVKETVRATVVSQGFC